MIVVMRKSALVLDERGEAELYGHDLRYDREDGLVVTRRAGS